MSPLFDRSVAALRLGARSLLRRPAFAALAVVALALGIGATTAIFTVVDAVLLAPLPFAEPERLVVITGSRPESGVRGTTLSAPDFADFRDRARTFEAMASVRESGVVLAGEGAPQSVPAGIVSEGFVSLFGLAPVLGRDLVAADGEPDADAVFLVSEALWAERFRSDPRAIGRVLRLDDRPATLVGVFPDELDFFGRVGELGILVPLRPEEELSRFFHSTRGFGRLRDGVPLAAADAELEAIAAALEAEHPDSNAGKRADAGALHEHLVGDSRPALLLLFGAVGMVLLVAAANVANMLLARGVQRQRELAVRSALGAGRGALAALFLAEGLVLAVAGGLAGIALASWGLDLLVALAPDGVPRLDAVRVDGTVLAFALGVSVLTGVIAGVAPALMLCRRELRPDLGERGGTSGVGSGRLRASLVVAEIATTLVLLVGAGLLIRSFSHLLAVDPGFDPSGTLVFDAELVTTRYPEKTDVAAAWERLDAALAEVQGVELVGRTSTLPYTDTKIAFDLWPLVGEPMPTVSLAPSASFHLVDEEYFATMGMSLVAGRLFGLGDDGEPRTVVVNETLAREHFPGRDPLGQRMLVNLKPDTEESEAYEVIGVVRDVRQHGLHLEAEAEMYLPQRQWRNRYQTVVVRAVEGLDPLLLAEPVRRAMEGFDPEIPVQLRTMESLVEDSLVRRRFTLLLLSLLGGLALVLAAVGIYGVLSTTVAGRRREMSIRLALGARNGQILSQVLAGVLRLAAAGVGLGLLGAFALSRTLEDLVFEVSPTDPATYAVQALVLVAVALAAGWFPARRATRVDPMAVLREE